MDGTGALDSESYFIIQQFQNGAYRTGLNAFEAIQSTASDHVKLYAVRSHLALDPPNVSSALGVLSTLSDPSTLDARALNAFTSFLSATATDDASMEDSLGEMEDILASLGDAGLDPSQSDDQPGRLVRSIIATAFIKADLEERRDEAIELLKEGVELGHDQECLAVLVHTYLALDLPQLAAQAMASSKEWTSDSLLSQLLGARTSLATGPAQKYQDAYYVFEEVKSLQGGRSENVLNGVAVAQATLGRWREAHEAIIESSQMNEMHADTLANSIALAMHNGRPTQEADASFIRLQQSAPSHPLVIDLANKANEFDMAAQKFASVAS